MAHVKNGVTESKATTTGRCSPQSLLTALRDTSLTIEPAAAVDEQKHYQHFAVGDNPLAHVATNGQALLSAFGGEYQPGLYRAPKKAIANPAPLGLSAFALTTFVLSMINAQVRSLKEPDIVIALALGYGGLVQLLAGMWEMAIGNTFGATALSSYGGFWIAVGLILTPGMQIASQLEAVSVGTFFNSMGLFFIGWTIFTALLMLCTLKSTLMFFLMFFILEIAFVCLSAGYLAYDANGPNTDCIKAAGAFGIAAAFLAWYNALAGLMDSTNSFFVLPVIHFPWSEKGREAREKRMAAANGGTV